jgi:hypothetical protein
MANRPHPPGDVQVLQPVAEHPGLVQRPGNIGAEHLVLAGAGAVGLQDQAGALVAPGRERTLLAVDEHDAVAVQARDVVPAVIGDEPAAVRHAMLADQAPDDVQEVLVALTRPGLVRLDIQHMGLPTHPDVADNDRRGRHRS